MKKYNSAKAFSIVLAMGLTLLLNFLGLYVIEYMVPFSQNIKGVENASQSFYEAYSGIEDSLLLVSQTGAGYEVSNSFSGVQDYAYGVTANGTLIPKLGEGNSEYNADWNKISQTEPIQLLIGKNRLSSWGNRILFSVWVPDFDKNGSPDSILTSSGFLLWQISSNTLALSSQSLLSIGVNQNIWTSNGTDAQNIVRTFSSFYTTNCIGINECVLKISLVNSIKSDVDGSIFPYLEYQIRTSNSIPLREAAIISDGKSYGFSKRLEVSVPQLTTNSAFDFTVFQ